MIGIVGNLANSDEMCRSAVYARNEVQRLLRDQQVNLNPSFVKCMGSAVKMIEATRVELFPFHVLREDKRAHLLSMLEDILKMVKRFTQQVKLEYDTFKNLQSTLPSLPSGRRRSDLADPTPLLGLVKIIEHWKKILPPLREASRSFEFFILDHFTTFFHQAIFMPFCETKGSPNDKTSTTLKPVIDDIALGLEDLVLVYKRLNDSRVDVEDELEAAFRRVEDIPFEWKQHLYQLSCDSDVSMLPTYAGFQAETMATVLSTAPQLPAPKPLQDLSQIDLIRKFTDHTICRPTNKPNQAVARVVSTSSQETIIPTPHKPTPASRPKKRPDRLTVHTPREEKLYPDVVLPEDFDAFIYASSTTRKFGSSTKSSSTKSCSAPENVYPISGDQIVNGLRKVQSEEAKRRAPQSPADETFPRYSDVEKLQKSDHMGKDICDMYEVLNSPIDTGSPNDTSSPTKRSLFGRAKGPIFHRKSGRSSTTQSSSSGTSPYVSQHTSRSQSRTGLHVFRGSLGSVEEHAVPVPPIPQQVMPTLKRTKTEPERPGLVEDFGASTSFGSVSSDSALSAKSDAKPSFLRKIKSKAQLNVRDRKNTWPGQSSGGMGQEEGNELMKNLHEYRIR